MDPQAEHVRVNRKNARRIVRKTDEARYKRLIDNRYKPTIDIISKYVGKDVSFIDIGIREGKFLEVLRDRGFTNIHGVDVYAEGVERAKGLGFDVKVADALDFSFGKKFDMATMTHVLEHCPDVNKAIQNIYDNVLNNDGILYVEVPTQKKEPVPTPHAHYFCFTSMEELLSFFDKSKWDLINQSIVGRNLKIVLRKLKGD